MSKKFMRSIIIFLIIFISLYVLSKEKSILVNSGEMVSDKKICWGIKRNDNNLQPDLGIKNLEIINKFNGIAIGDSEKKCIYLTFDNGYEAGYTENILNTLKENDVKATFFITAHYLNTQPDLVKKMIDEGHIVGNHTVNHKSMPDLDNSTLENEVMKLHLAVYEKFGYELKYIRPPMGEISERTLELTNNLGYITVMWSFAYDDWNENNQKGEDYAKSKIINNIHPGSVILLHANSKDNMNVLDYCIKEIKNMGYEIKTLDEFER